MPNSTLNSSKLVIVWTSDDKEVALRMVFMYALNAKLYESGRRLLL